VEMDQQHLRAVQLASVSLVALAALAVKIRRNRPTEWERTLEKVSQGVVVVRVSCAMAFDMNDAGFSVATGFIVDRVLGIIMTNRHVVTTGPVTADAVLLNKEEVELTPLYADPVHDFGFFRYNPAHVKYMQVHQIPLTPQKARVGLDVRVVGNDAGEKVSILSGTLARLDRSAPDYGSHVYNDFNTFYMSCASNTSGGSSGSPVVDYQGNAIALNAGTSTKSASSYYLPLERPLRALRLLQAALTSGSDVCASHAIPRGSIGCVFVHKAFGEIRRLGLRVETEALVRAAVPQETGMLVVEQLVPGGTACNVLQPGDVLLRVEGKRHPTRMDWCTTFLQLEDLVDDSVGEEITIHIERGFQELSFILRVTDLHELSPTSLLEVGGCSLHALSFQQARNWNLMPGSVHASYSGYMLSNVGVPSRAIIKELNAVRTPTLEDFLATLLTLHDGARVPLRYVVPLYSQYQERLAVITIDRTWFACVRYDLDAKSGRWVASKPPPPPPPPPLEPQHVKMLLGGPPEVQAITPMLVRVLFDIPYQVDGVADRKFVGTGLVVSAERGLVLVDRNTVPVALGDARVEFASTVEVPATTLFLHPTHNFGLVQYDPRHVHDNCIGSAVLSDVPLEVGDECMFVGLSKTEAARPVFQQCVVRELCVMHVRTASVPRFRPINEEIVRFDLGLSLDDTIGGVFVDSKGAVKAVWFNYCNCSSDEELYEQFEGLPIQAVIPSIEQHLRCSNLVSLLPTENADSTGQHEVSVPDSLQLYFLDAELKLVSLSKACGTSEGSGLGLSREWAAKLSECGGGKRQVLIVRRLMPGLTALKEGDLILAIEGRAVNTFTEVEAAIKRDHAEITILRDRKEQTVTAQCSRVKHDN